MRFGQKIERKARPKEEIKINGEKKPTYSKELN